ncbi:VOC family protein [Limnobacter humi]|uniref:VOC family protein n=1 Tax=Limnobacter humi TaxID=1778671 RepID=A0ABT1WHG5_9BURK|nr:VOC family protein [Limnobacter humi]MCQ8896481.1 VOC family protein [Limnobacter humi]
MPFVLDHVVVFTDPGAPELDALLVAGLCEGSGNVHPGQGTANRRVFFEQGFLECLWVHDKNEATSPLTQRTQLWERWLGRKTGTNPFGLCFAPSAFDVEALPFDCWLYQPSYLPEGKSIHFAEHNPLHEPLLFALGWPQSASTPQPRTHAPGFQGMQSVSIGLPDINTLSAPLRTAVNAGLVHVHLATQPELVIRFLSLNAVEHRVPSLGLVLVGHPQS